MNSTAATRGALPEGQERAVVRTTPSLRVAAALFARGFVYRGAALEGKRQWVCFRFAARAEDFDRAVSEYYNATAPPVQARALLDALDMLRNEVRDYQAQGATAEGC